MAEFVAARESINCHGCKYLDRYKTNGSGYCAKVSESKTQSGKRARFPNMPRCELYASGDWKKRFDLIKENENG